MKVWEGLSKQTWDRVVSDEQQWVAITILRCIGQTQEVTVKTGLFV